MRIELPKLWSASRESDGSWRLADSGCGCCGGDEPLTLKRLDEAIKEFRTAIDELNAIRQEIEAAQKTKSV